MSRIKRPSPALVVAILALVAAIVVPAFALTKKETRVVRKIANAQISKRAPALSVASANRANTANSAATAGDAETLDGQDAGDFAPVGAEAWQPMALNDGSPFGTVHEYCFWTAVGDGHTAPAYFRDSAGVVHLKGFVRANDGNVGVAEPCGSLGLDIAITELPEGYQPGDEEWTLATVSNHKPGEIVVFGPGEVAITAGFPTFTDAKQWVSLDGIAFRCAPSGQDGCP